MIKEAQQENLTFLEWEPAAELAFRLKQALLHTPALGLPTGQDFNLYVMKGEAWPSGSYLSSEALYSNPWDT